MSEKPGPPDISCCRSIESLQKALDQTYRYLLETAKADWQRLFGGHDPSDNSVSVRVSKEEMGEELTGTPRAALFHKQNKSMKPSGRRRLA